MTLSAHSKIAAAALSLTLVTSSATSPVRAGDPERTKSSVDDASPGAPATERDRATVRVDGFDSDSVLERNTGRTILGKSHYGTFRKDVWESVCAVPCDAVVASDDLLRIRAPGRKDSDIFRVTGPDARVHGTLGSDSGDFWGEFFVGLGLLGAVGGGVEVARSGPANKAGDATVTILGTVALAIGVTLLVTNRNAVTMTGGSKPALSRGIQLTSAGIVF